MSKVLQKALMTVQKRKAKYYYHCKVDGVSGKQMTELVAKCQQAEQAASDWVEKQGGINYIESPYGLAGGVSFVIFDHDPNVGDVKLWALDTDIDTGDTFDAEQVAQGAGVYKVNVPDDLDMKPYLKGNQNENENENTDGDKKHGMAALAQMFHKKQGMGIVAKEGTAVALAVERMQLPIVNIAELMFIVRPEQRMITMPDGKKRPLPIRMTSTPRFFEHEGWWYIELPFAIEGEGWSEITERTFATRMRQAVAKAEQPLSPTLSPEEGKGVD